MLNISLRAQQLSPEVMLLRLPHTFRVFFALLTAILLYGIFVGGGFGVVPVLLLAVSLFALFYDERWRFDRERGVVEWRIGPVGLVRPGRVGLSEVDRFVLGDLVRGQAPGTEAARPGPFAGRLVQRRYVHLTLVTREGQEYDIERRAARSGESLQQIAREVARFCERPLDEGE